MDFVILFTIASALSFTMQFGVDSGPNQDYFMFQGKNQTAHLHRKNQTVYLHLVQGNNLETYVREMEETEFLFSWNHQMINGKPMNVIKKIGNVTSMHFDLFTFISPVYDAFEDLDCNIQTQIKGVNYWHIVGVAILVAFLCKANLLPRRVIAALLTKEHRQLLNQTSDLVDEILTGDTSLIHGVAGNDMNHEEITEE